MGTVLRAIAAYWFLVIVIRALPRRPGGQMTPFELVLIFLFGGMSIQAVVADHRSLINAFIGNLWNRSALYTWDIFRFETSASDWA